MIGPSAHPAGHENGAALTLAWRSVIRAGFALPRDAGQRPAQFSRWGLQAVPTIAPSALRALRHIRTVGVRLSMGIENGTGFCAGAPRRKLSDTSAWKPWAAIRLR